MLLKEIMVENFPNVGRNLDIQVYEDNVSHQNFNSKYFSPRDIRKLSKIKEQEFQMQQEKKILSHKGTLRRVTAHFSSETLQTRRKWDNTLNVLKEGNCQIRILYPAK